MSEVKTDRHGSTGTLHKGKFVTWDELDQIKAAEKEAGQTASQPSSPDQSQFDALQKELTQLKTSSSKTITELGAERDQLKSKVSILTTENKALKKQVKELEKTQKAAGPSAPVPSDKDQKGEPANPSTESPSSTEG
ncbi:hypothetical protein [Deinococcus misasensis]|uniref:hypothetical protein n=1 Tax=Deinococcus misasensis TaxID=392413 RepID=UPI00055719FE|nr:hypothetical protein [Deinococcus misasensis]